MIQKLYSILFIDLKYLQTDWNLEYCWLSLFIKFVFLVSSSCQYGDRCKFLHATQQQQPKPYNAFGFGSQNATQFPRNNTQQQQQQQKPNPFGFGVQSSSQARGAIDFGSKQNQFKVYSLLHFTLKQIVILMLSLTDGMLS